MLCEHTAAGNLETVRHIIIIVVNAKLPVFKNQMT